MKLYTKIAIGLGAGAAVGLAVNLLESAVGLRVVGWITPIGDAWIRAITMIVIPLIVASLIVGAASLGDLRALGRIGGKTVSYYLLTTTAAVTIGLVLSNLVKPGSGLSDEAREGLNATFAEDAAGRIELAAQKPGLVDVLLNMIPENPVASAAQGDLLPLIVFSIFFGVAASLISDETRRRSVIGFFEGVNEIAMTIVHWVMLAAPYAVFALIASVTAQFGLDILSSLLKYTLVVIFGLLLHAFGTYGFILRFFAGVNPVAFYRRIREVQLLGFSTSSSSATLPLTMTVAQDACGASRKISSFVLPLGSTINMDGTALYQGVAVMFIAQVFGIDLSIGDQLVVVVTATLASIGAAGVPSAGIITLTLVLINAGVPETGIALILGVDRVLDMLRTAVNITGDLTGTMLIARTEGEQLNPEVLAKPAPAPSAGLAAETRADSHVG